MASSWIFTGFLLCYFILQYEPTFAAFENVAGGKTAYQSSYYSGYSETSANKGCDGDNTQQTCILTNTNQPFTWWEVDLQKYYYVSQVWIYFRTDYAVRRNGIHVYTSNSSRQGNAGYDCGQVTGQPDGSDINDVTRITCNNVARYVTVYQATNNGNATAMDFCEVEVYACELGVKYGSTCDKVCNSRHCAVQSSSCNVQTGDCGTGRCQQGWTGVDCTTACKLGDNYGANCNRNCRYRHCVSQAAPCTTDTGDCGNEGCEPGWTGVDCTQPCSRGTYGSACSRQCSARHCEGVSTCDHITGGCVGGCQAGWTATDCTTECQEGLTYGSGCTRRCTDRYCLRNSQCDKKTGRCVGGCQSGWRESDCSQACMKNVKYGPNCNMYCNRRKCASSNRPCDVQTGNCGTGGCKPGYQGVDCTQGCSRSTYGSACSRQCSARHCEGDSTCDHVTGRCVNRCQAGWKGTDCTTACSSGYNYGPDCAKYCSQRHCVSSSSCNIQTGVCDVGGCTAGWMAVDCAQACERGVKYGSNCMKLCADRHCAPSGSYRSTCPAATGKCYWGCDPGWKGDDCTQECQEGLTYGSGCTNQCAGRHCLQNSTCDTKTGRCVGGCQSGWRKQDCSRACNSGRYGPSCSLQCSSRHCKWSSTATCNPVNGSCDNGCQSGWQGIDCTDCKGGLTYGNNCGKRCADRHCLNNSTCEANTGLCVGGCQPGWKDADCSKVCSWSWYGPSCSLSCTDRQCNVQSSCNTTDGKCETGCQTGWKGVDCTECNDRYGADCSLDCRTRHCKDNNSPCDSRTGECVEGCKPGWMNATCTQQCPSGKYGEGCLQECIDRRCYGSQRCDLATGQCVDGCIAGWQGVSCSEVKTDPTTVSPQQVSDSTTAVLSTVIGVLSVFVIIECIVIIRFILIFRKLRTSSGPSVSFSNKPNNRMTTTTSSVYEVVDSETDVRSPPVERVVNTQNGQNNDAQHDYVNSSHPAESSEENVNNYDRLDVDVIGEGSPYSKIED